IRVRNIRALNGRFNTSITHAYSIVIGSKHITLNATGGGFLTASKQFRHGATSKSRSNTASNMIKERILVIILLLHFLSLMLGSVLVLMLPLLVWLTPDLRIKKSLLKCNWTIRKRLPRCKMRLKKRLLAFSRRLHARIRKTR